MPPALLKAHQKLDTAVDAAYQPSGGKKTYASDAERVAFLFELYQRIISLLPATAVRKTRNPKSRILENFYEEKIYYSFSKRTQASYNSDILVVINAMKGRVK
jgi:hypothetical protein